MTFSNIPVHVAIIPDGNRRWAKERGLSSFEGHRRGFEQIVKIAKKAREMGIKILTLWAFSTENWNRTKEEVSYLMKLYEIMLDKNLQEALKDEARLIHLGRKDRLSRILKEKIINAEEKTKKNSKYFLNIALDYGGRNEIMRAFQRASSKFNPDVTSGQSSKLNEEDFNNFLDTKDLPQQDIDLIIRTSGEKRASGFMMWQATYAEYIFYNKYMPDFTPHDFETCISEYQKRQRRFGH